MQRAQWCRLACLGRVLEGELKRRSMKVGREEGAGGRLGAGQSGAGPDMPANFPGLTSNPAPRSHVSWFSSWGLPSVIYPSFLFRPPPRLMIPKEGVVIVFAPSGIRTPARAQPAGNGRPAVAGEPFGEGPRWAGGAGGE
jgi:hypothetical protein